MARILPRYEVSIDITKRRSTRLEFLIRRAFFAPSNPRARRNARGTNIRWKINNHKKKKKKEVGVEGVGEGSEGREEETKGNPSQPSWRLPSLPLLVPFPLVSPLPPSLHHLLLLLRSMSLHHLLLLLPFVWVSIPSAPFGSCHPSNVVRYVFDDPIPSEMEERDGNETEKKRCTRERERKEEVLSRERRKKDPILYHGDGEG